MDTPVDGQTVQGRRLHSRRAYRQTACFLARGVELGSIVYLIGEKLGCLFKNLIAIIDIIVYYWKYEF